MLDPRLWWAACAVVPTVVLGTTTFLWVLPSQGEAVMLRTGAEDLSAANERLVVENLRLAERNVEIATVRAEADEIRARVPVGLDAERLSRELHERATATGMTVSSFAQSAAVEVVGLYVGVPLAVEFVGPESADRSALLTMLQAGPGEAYGEGHDYVVTSVDLAQDESDPASALVLTVGGFLVLSAEIPVPEPVDTDLEEPVS